MQSSVFTSSRPYVESDNNFDNQIPDANRSWGNPFWGFVGNMLGLPDATASTPVRFLGLGMNRDDDVN